MSNNYFQFKQFTIYQDRCAMKVCTDACVFGAIAARNFGGSVQQKVLDIGAGTGLLSLMFAQKSNHAVIDAVEIDGNAAQQAAENFAASPWAERLAVHNTSIQSFAASQLIGQSTNQLYNLIITNPPFFENDLKSSDAKRNIALHSNELSLEELISAVKMLLRDDGIFGVLLPYHRTVYFEKLALENNFHLSKKILMKQTPVHDYFRSILFFERRKAVILKQEIVVKDVANQYSSSFVELLKDYYLYL